VRSSVAQSELFLLLLLRLCTLSLQVGGPTTKVSIAARIRETGLNCSTQGLLLNQKGVEGGVSR
jgi:hypothetical protein